MSLTFSKTLTLAAVATAIAIGSIALPGVSAPAEAKKISFFKKGFRSYAYVGTGLLLASGYYGYYHGCHWLKVRAIRTGSDYWWDRYHACRGD